MYHEFVKLTHPERLQSWFLGWSDHHKQYVSWSDCSFGPGSFKQMETIEELRSLFKWYKSKGYKLMNVYQDNIDAFAR